jgi:hypothetical protein
MKTKVPPDATVQAKTLAPSNPPQYPAAEQVRSDARRRIILKSTMKAAKKSRLSQQPKVDTIKETARKVSPRSSVTGLSEALARKLPTVPPAEADEPQLSPKAIRALGFAVKSMERQDWSLNRRRFVAYHHLQSDRALTDVSPDDLIREDPSTNQ